ncbi:MarR family winged helix-turn-helix transcriptional regulator [Virgibacillus sp. W0430]|uniref:MarR family winged helix-turn-helix transcriptional regulator n=1 Tax=Virgibacillus sp. W0430 TaxID=3391580 RepID=UPI003F445C5D
MSIDKEDVFGEFEKLFWDISKDMSHLWKKIFNKRFPGSQSYILFLLERNGPKRMSEIAEYLKLTPGAVTIASDRLLENGYIDRVRDEKDRRVVYLKITEKGRVSLKELQNEGRKTTKLVFNHVSNTDLQRMIAVFRQASKNIDGIRKEYDA